ncbi:MAG: DoxX family protein [Bacteroidetes bacterium]|nr:DoxX family protein [Bacteroidota bacterium]
MKKRDKVIYWIATVWLALGMVSTGIVQLIQLQEEQDKMSQLGYPFYLMTLLGVWKIAGVVVVLIPKFPVLKEWAYAGFFFAMSGAAISHMAAGSPTGEIFPSVLLLILTVVSWYFRPASRKIAPIAISNE